MRPGLSINYSKCGISAGCYARGVMRVTVDCEGNTGRYKTAYGTWRGEHARHIGGNLGIACSHGSGICLGIYLHNYIRGLHGIYDIIDMTLIPRLVLYAGAELR